MSNVTAALDEIREHLDKLEERLSSEEFLEFTQILVYSVQARFYQAHMRAQKNKNAE